MREGAEDVTERGDPSFAVANPWDRGWIAGGTPEGDGDGNDEVDHQRGECVGEGYVLRGKTTCACILVHLVFFLSLVEDERWAARGLLKRE